LTQRERVWSLVLLALGICAATAFFVACFIGSLAVICVTFSVAVLALFFAGFP
jgi:hypothetical protein